MPPIPRPARAALAGALALACVLLGTTTAGAANPVIPDRFVADPSAHVFDGRMYLYATDDETNSGSYWDSSTWRGYSSTDLGDWTDHGDVFGVRGFSWASRYAWAPGAAQGAGRYHLYLPVDRTKIGVASGPTPTGPFSDARGNPLVDQARDANVGDEPIDPMVFTDVDGRSYLYFGTRVPKVVQLGADMVSTTGPITDLRLSGQTTYGEAPFVHRVGSTYYFSYSTGWPGQIHYATGPSPLGPFTHRGVLLDYVNTFTNHQSIVEYQGGWYLVYHRAARPGGGDYKRSIVMDRLYHRPDGTIATVVQTPGGVGPFRTLTAQHSGLRLSTTGSDDGSPAIQAAGAGGRWQLRTRGSGTVEVIDRASGRCLDVSRGSTADGADVLIWGCHGAVNQLWTVREVGAGVLTLVNANSGRCLDVSRADRTDGARLIQWACTGSANQRWRTEPVSD